MAATSGLSHTTVRRIWRAFGLQPHRVENFKLSNDPKFIEKVRDIVGLYLNPPDAALGRSTRALEDAIRLYLAVYNKNPKPFVWVKTADQILDSIRRFCLRTSVPGH